MNYLLRLLVVGILAGVSMLCAQNFSGSDDFSSVTGKWSADTTAAGAFTVGGGVLNFTGDALAPSGTSYARRDWNLNVGSYVADWQVQVECTINLSPVAEQSTSWTLILANNTDNTDNARLTFQQTNIGAPSLNVQGVFVTNNTGGMPVQLAPGSTAVTLRASFVAASHQLTLDYSTGAGFSTVTSAALDGGLTNWGMGSSDTFGLRLLAANEAGGTGTATLSSGVYADNFLATGAAIPEPATYAAGLGVLAVCAAGLRRRFGQQ